MMPKYLLLTILGLFSCSLTAQFTTLPVLTEQLSGPSESPQDIAKVGNTLYGTFASSATQFFMEGGGLLRSDDDGQTWTVDPNFAGQHIVQVGNFQNVFLVVEYDRVIDNNGNYNQRLRVHRSADGGLSYTLPLEIKATAYGAPPYGGHFEAGIFREINGVLFLTYTEKYNSTDNLHSWYSTDQGLSWKKTLYDSWSQTSYSNRRNKISGSDGWFFYNVGISNYIVAAQKPDFSDANFITFSQKYDFREVYSVNDQLIAVTQSLLFFGTDWSNTDNLQWLSLNNVDAALLANNYLFTFGRFGTFSRAPASQPELLAPVAFYPYQSRFYTPNDFRQIGSDVYLLANLPLRSPDDGLSWSWPASNLPISYTLKVFHNQLWTQRGFLYRSIDGAQWTLHQPQGLKDEQYDWDNIAEIQGRMFLSGGFGFNEKVYRSDDGGFNWSLVFDLPGKYGSGMVIADATQTKLYYLYMSNTSAIDLFVSENLGDTWTQLNDPDPPFDDFVAKGDTLFFAKNNQLLYSYDQGSTWNTTALNFTFPDALHHSKMILTADGKLFLLQWYNKVGYLSTDWGKTFTQTLQMPAILPSVTFQDSMLIMGTSNANTNNWGTYLTTDAGLSGVNLKDGPWQRLYGYTIKDGYLYGSLSPNGGIIRTDLQAILDALQYNNNLGVVEARVFFDRNQNCVQEPDEESVPVYTLVFQPGNFLASSDHQGIIRRVLPAQTYTVQAAPIPGTQPVNCSPATIGVSTGNVSSLTLGFNPQGFKDLSIEIAATALRPGFPGQFTLTVRNNGVEPVPAGAVLRFRYPDDKINFISGSPSALATGMGTVDFSLPDIPVFGSTQFTVFITIQPDPNLTNQFLHVDAELLPPYQDDLNINHIVSRSFRVTNSFDPNDKTAFTASPDGQQLPVNDRNLQYLIRFQNTGTDTAFSIVVADTLSPKLDWTTLRTVASSHPYRVTVSDPGVVRWRFDNILLPDSSTNEAASHGFVLFSIQAKANIFSGNILENTASIYFDFNLPVQTNTTQTTVVRRLRYRETETASETAELEIAPNPVGDMLHWQTQVETAGTVSARIIDASGRVVQELWSNYPVTEAGLLRFSHPVPTLAPGRYWLEFRSAGQRLTGAFLRL